MYLTTPSYIGIENEDGQTGLSYPETVADNLEVNYYPEGETPANLTSSTKRAPTTRTLPGDRIQYTVVVSNTGDQNASNTTMQDSIPAGTSYITDSLDSNGMGTATYNSAQSRIEWSGDVAGETAVHITYAVTASDSLDPFDVIENTATINSDDIPEELTVSASVCIDCGLAAGQSNYTSPYTAPVKPALAESYAVGSAIDAGIVVGSDGTVYAAGSNGKVCAFPATGGERCNNYGLSPVSSTLTLANNGRMYIGAGSSLLALAADGTEEWRFEEPDGTIFSSPGRGRRWHDLRWFF